MLRNLGFVCVVLIGAAAVGLAADPFGDIKDLPVAKPEDKVDMKPVPPPKDALVLFDGKSLDGWEAADFAKPGAVKIEDGAILLPEGKPMTGVSCTHKDLFTTDYELSYEAMRTSGRDFFAAATFPVGKAHITLVNGGWGERHRALQPERGGCFGE